MRIERLPHSAQAFSGDHQQGEDDPQIETAGVRYIGHLQALDTATSLDRGATLAIQMLSSAPLPIHDALASVQLASIRGLPGPFILTNQKLLKTHCNESSSTLLIFRRTKICAVCWRFLVLLKVA